MIWTLTATAFDFPREFVEEIEKQEINTLNDSIIKKTGATNNETDVFFGKNRKSKSKEPRSCRGNKKCSKR
jgi:hypothetical protein